ncbi:hypothetical protein MLD52_09555 [Puniceicoccaceae bacterium K14]|nr:hypothetical protein [Puniceicoccaceae bacterium K14]
MYSEIDKYTEPWLELETRRLPMSDGSKRDFRCMRIFWGSFDFLMERFEYTPDRLVEIAYKSSLEEDADLDDHFPKVMAFLEKELCRVWDVKD